MQAGFGGAASDFIGYVVGKHYGLKCYGQIIGLICAIGAEGGQSVASSAAGEEVAVSSFVEVAM